jgi:hypothetical protein
MRTLLTTVLLTMSAVSLSYAYLSYQGSADLDASGGSIRAVHRHDWSTPETRKSAFLKVLDLSSGRELLTIGSPALTFLWVSSDGAYVVGLSDETYDNPYQLLVVRVRDKAVARKPIWCPDPEAADNPYGCSMTGEGAISWYDEADPGIAVLDDGKTVRVRVKPATPWRCEAGGVLKLTAAQRREYRCDSPPAFIEFTTQFGAN